MLLGAPSGRQQINKESKDVESKDERDDPFENGCYVLSTIKRDDCKDDCQDILHNHEGEAQDTMLAEMHAKTLILSANKAGADDVAGHEEEEEAVV